MRILLLSGYDAGSHQRWRNLITELNHTWEVLTLPARHFPWRSRSNALTWAMGSARAALERPYDLVLATSMVDVATLKGLVPKLAQVPWITYWHENQFAYPVNPKAQGRLVNLQMLNIYTALASTICVFNSEFNRSTFIDGAQRLLRRMPDHVPSGIREVLAARSRVIPVPIDDTLFRPTAPKSGPLTILWNHRWEYDKAPERFFQALRLAAGDGADFRVSVVGQSFRNIPDAFVTGRHDLRNRIDHWGFLTSRDAYERLLGSRDVVVSTALHEFQGLAIQEAVARGCQPLVPNRLAYPEHFGGQNLYESNVDDQGREAENLATILKTWAESPPIVRSMPIVEMNTLRWSELGPVYRNLFLEFSL